MKLSAVLAASTALASVAAAAPAFAQESEEGGVEAPSTIIVTAQRREQELLDVPVAVTTLGSAQLEQQQVDDVLDLNAASPSVFSNALSSPLANAPVRIRGIGTGGGNPGFEGAVGMYVDEVFRSRAGAALTTFFDMDGVDILRGPQGTLFGKNTTAGAIVQRTAEPELGETRAYVVGEYANYDSYELEGMVNLALGDEGAFRFSGMIDRTDGFFTDFATGDPTADTQIDALRAQVKLEPSADLDFRVVADWSSWRTAGNYGRSTRIDARDLDGRQNTAFAALGLGVTPLGPVTGSGYWYWDPADPAGTVDPFARVISTNRLADQTLDQFGITAHVNWDVSDSVTLRSITGWRNIDSDNLNGDFDFGPIDLAGRLDVIQKIDSFSQEFLLNGDFAAGDMEIDWIIGFNYFAETIDYNRIANFGPVFATLFGAPPGAAPFGNDYEFQDLTSEQKEDSYGVFGQVTLGVTDTLDIIGGIRWNKIDKSLDYVSNLGSPEQYFDNVTSNVLGLLLADAALQTAFPYQTSTSDEEITYNVALQWRPIPELQVYGSLARGFKAGGFNLTENGAGGEPSVLRGAPLLGVDELVTVPVFGTIPRLFFDFDPERAIFAPEFVDAYEVGVRYEFAPRSLVSITGFWSDYSDLQVSVFNGLTFEVVNAGTSTSKGIELEANWRASDNISLNLGATYLDATYGNDVRGLPGGRQRGLAPDLALVAGVAADWPVTDDIDVYFNASGSYLTEMFLAEGGCQDAAGAEGNFETCLANPLLPDNQLALQQQDSYVTVTASIGLRSFDNWDVSVFCNNCFDEDFFIYAFNQPFLGGGAPMGNPGAPRTYGVRLRKDF